MGTNKEQRTRAVDRAPPGDPSRPEWHDQRGRGPEYYRDVAFKCARDLRDPDTCGCSTTRPLDVVWCVQFTGDAEYVLVDGAVVTIPGEVEFVALRGGMVERDLPGDLIWHGPGYTVVVPNYAWNYAERTRWAGDHVHGCDLMTLKQEDPSGRWMWGGWGIARRVVEPVGSS